MDMDMKDRNRKPVKVKPKPKANASARAQGGRGSWRGKGINATYTDLLAAKAETKAGAAASGYRVCEDDRARTCAVEVGTEEEKGSYGDNDEREQAEDECGYRHKQQRDDGAHYQPVRPEELLAAVGREALGARDGNVELEEAQDDEH